MKKLFVVFWCGAAQFVKIAEPEKNGIVYADSVDAQNRVPVKVVLHYYDVPSSNFSVWFRIDRGQTLTLGPPLPSSTLEIALRLGTHVIEVKLGEHIASTVFDVVPVGEILKAKKTTTTGLRPRGDVYDYDCLSKTVKIVLVGSLALGGQAMLALEQARYLPHLRLLRGGRAFDIRYASSGDEGPLRALLEELGVPVVRYKAEMPWDLVERLKEFAEDPGSAVGLALSKYNNFHDVPPDLQLVAGDLVRIFQYADIVSFTNHESFLGPDRFIVECARLARTPVVLNEPANLWWGEPPTGLAEGLIDGLILPSEFAANFWRTRHGGNVPHYVVNPGITTEEESASILGESLRIGFVGRLAPQKSPGLFIRAAAVLANLYKHSRRKVSFVIIGDGPLREFCEALAKDLGVDIEFTGWLAPSEVRGAIRKKLDVVVHTNILEETFCMCNVEAMAEAKIVVSFGVGGVSEYLKHGDDHGIIVDSPSVPALVSALVGLIEDFDSEIGRRAALRVRGGLNGTDLSFLRMAKQYANMYASLMCGDVVSRAVDVACQNATETMEDPGELLERGDYWAGACSMARHIAMSLKDRDFDSYDVDRFHGLALALAVASEVFVTSETPVPGSREARALAVVVDLAEAALKDADHLGRQDKIPGLARCAAMARGTLGGSPDETADRYFQVATSRRRNNVDESSSTGVSVAINGGNRVIELSIAGSSLGDKETKERRFLTSVDKLRHDARQFDYLATKEIELDPHGRGILQEALGGREETDSSLLRAMATAYGSLADDVEGGGPAALMSLWDLNTSHAVASSWGKLIHVVRPPRSQDPAVRIPDAKRVAEEFERNGLTVMDGVLSPEALELLRSQFLESTMWFDMKRGHLGAYLDDGLASGILMQISEEFQNLLDPILQRKRLVQAWAYKFLHNGDFGIRPHADEGAVTINCWVTPDDMNRNFNIGGLRIYHAVAPTGLDFVAANHDFRRLMATIGDTTFTDVPHRTNRCLAFRSRLIHATQPLDFHDAYDAHRINLSLMYGSTAFP